MIEIRTQVYMHCKWKWKCNEEKDDFYFFKNMDPPLKALVISLWSYHVSTYFKIYHRSYDTRLIVGELVYHTFP